MSIQILVFLLFSKLFMAIEPGQENTLIPQTCADETLPDSCGPVCATKKPTASNLIYQSLDGGHSWQDISDGLPEIFPIEAIFADQSHVILSAETGYFRSNTTKGETGWTPEFSLNERIRDFFPGRAGLYANSYWNGLFQKVPGSDFWRPMFTTMDDKRLRCVLETGEGRVLIGCDGGMYKTSDAGKTWKLVLDSCGVNSLVAYDGVLIGGSSRGLFRSTDGGERWQQVLSGADPIFKTGRIKDGLFVIVNGAGSIGTSNSLYTSADGGKTWQCLDESLASLRYINNYRNDPAPRHFIIDLKQAGKFLICSMDNGIFRSADQGKSWELVFATHDRKVYEIAVSGKIIYAVPVGGGC